MRTCVEKDEYLHIHITKKNKKMWALHTRNHKLLERTMNALLKTMKTEQREMKAETE
jgi:hypothetical protein